MSLPKTSEKMIAFLDSFKQDPVVIHILGEVDPVEPKNVPMEFGIGKIIGIGTSSITLSSRQEAGSGRHLKIAFDQIGGVINQFKAQEAAKKSAAKGDGLRTFTFEARNGEESEMAVRAQTRVVAVFLLPYDIITARLIDVERVLPVSLQTQVSQRYQGLVAKNGQPTRMALASYKKSAS